MANRRPPWKIPAVIDPPLRRCIQINIPDDPEHIAIFWGLLRGLSDWQRWEREPTKSGTLVAKVWSEVVYAIDWEDGCMGCCNDQIVLHRIGAGDALEISTDGGTTWTPDPADPRINGTHLPNSIPGADDGKKCNGATNAVNNFKDAQAAFSHDLTSSTTIIGLAAAIAGELLVLLLSAGTLAEVLVPLMITTAATLFGVLEADYNAEFTEAVWDDLLCDLFCNIGSNGQFTEGQFHDLQADVDTHFSNNVALTFQSILRGWGTLGLNNACISGTAATADCSECDCVPSSCSDPDRFEKGNVLSTVDNGDGTVTFTVETVPEDGSGIPIIVWGNRHTASAECCTFIAVNEVAGGATVLQGFIACGNEPPVGIGYPSPDLCVSCLQFFPSDFVTNFTIELTMGTLNCP
jgi:hypothetical protein